MMEQYKGASFGELTPHPFAIVDATYNLMINEEINQSILVNGKLKDVFPSCTWATTFLQWHKDNCYIFQIKPSLHFTQ